MGQISFCIHSFFGHLLLWLSQVNIFPQFTANFLQEPNYLLSELSDPSNQPSEIGIKHVDSSQPFQNFRDGLFVRFQLQRQWESRVSECHGAEDGEPEPVRHCPVSHRARHGHLQLPGGLPARTAGLCGVCWPGRWAWGPLAPELPVGCSQAGRWLSSTVVVSPLFTPPPCPLHPSSGHCATLSSHNALSFTVCLVPATVLTAVQLLNLHILLQEKPPRHHVVHSAFDILTFPPYFSLPEG